MNRFISVLLAMAFTSFNSVAGELVSGDYAVTGLINSSDAISAIQSTSINLRVAENRVRYKLKSPCETYRGSYEKQGDKLSLIMQVKTGASCQESSLSDKSDIELILRAMESAGSYEVKKTRDGSVIVILEDFSRNKLALKMNT